YFNVSLVGLFFVFVLGSCVNGDLSYTVQEEMKPGSVFGNIAKDLGLELGRLAARKSRVEVGQNGQQYCGINQKNGDIFITERIDREEHCREMPTCNQL
uniref:Cadherin N-terminal domain-containing protein n=1 Tax=Oryzias sinensis TaxID=183150 RepID=A0A8C7WW90_9TELE